jgi:hypothetical protein
MIYEGLNFNTDSNFCVLQNKSTDGGDTPSRDGDLFFYIGITNDPNFISYQFDFQKALNYIAIPNSPGNYYRYPPEYANPTDFSRDQSMQLGLGMGAMKLAEPLKAMMLADLKRYSRTQNDDIIGPWDWAMRFRCLYNCGYKWIMLLWPLIMLADIGLVANSLLISLLLGRTPNKLQQWLANKLGMYYLVQQYPSSSAPNNPDAWSPYGYNCVSNDVLHVLNLIAAKKWLPTPISWLAKKLYLWLRPVYANIPYISIDGLILRNCDVTNGATYSWDVYFSPVTGANPLNDLFRNELKDL